MVMISRNTNTLLLTTESKVLVCDLKSEQQTVLEIPAPVLPDNLTKDQRNILLKHEKTVNSVDFSLTDQYMLLSTENKQILVYSSDLKLIKNFTVNRVPSKAVFTPSNDIIVADKTGDVYLYELEGDEKPTLLLGHLSIILDVLVTKDGKYIITCDRDEKIRVSHFPNCYNIATFCLGHTEFVTCIKVEGKILISASGDGTVQFWDFLRGKQLNIVNTNAHVEESNTLLEFSETMDKEKVDVSALPVINVQISENFMAVQLHKCSTLQLYSVDFSKNKCEVQLIFKLCIAPIFSFCFSKLELIVFSDRLRTFKLENNQFVEIESVFLRKLCDNYKANFKHLDEECLTVLYKRKFDNMQEYYERKKQRIESLK
ncbi:unnamed protein product [Acanthoscelides obtectus]|uniref:tRNA (guanine-N(7)-)-methyltransferase non-catalytic subunit wuho n=1 Tax=Acanthoscelides obtectus TaxID=200917 RepID=A0A9P0PQG9_ACAOB|nr:unnamed protein product [Acanthoscelides obtectus]CAK1675696.1 tRNA (guanine-N(7)-)-methyltransferase non-catalytic subunit wuho [Acanthoscelides obtectus]